MSFTKLKDLSSQGKCPFPTGLNQIKQHRNRHSVQECVEASLGIKVAILHKLFYHKSPFQLELETDMFM